MIHNFEIQTKPLTEWEKFTLLPAMVKELAQHRSSGNAIKSDHLAERMKLATGQKPNGARIRKVVNAIRIGGYLRCLSSTSDGYFVAVNRDEIADCALSLQQRAGQIWQVAEALKLQMDATFPTNPQQTINFD